MEEGVLVVFFRGKSFRVLKGEKANVLTHTGITQSSA